MRFLSSHRNPIAAVIAIVAFGGVYAYVTMQKSLFPEITFPKIKIIADAGQLPVDRMMITVTRQLENAIKRVPDLERIRSITSRGSCEISAFLSWSSDIDISMQRIESRIAQIRDQLPADIQISVEKMNPSILPVIGYAMDAPNRTPIELRRIAEYTVKPFLSQVDGVAEVRVMGGKRKEYWIVLDPVKAGRLGWTPDAVAAALQQTNFVKSNGYLSDFRRMYLTLTDASVANREELASLVIGAVGRRVVRLRDIADVEVHEAKEYVKIDANGRESVLLAVVKQPGANLVRLSEDMDAKLHALRRLIPKDIAIRPYYEQADFVNDAVRSVRDAVLVGIALALGVSLLFLRSFRIGVTILVVVPLSLLLTLLVLRTTGQTFNIMTLGAMAAAIGLVIDDAIVVAEQIHRTREERAGVDAHAIVHGAISYLFPAMLGSSLSTIVIFLPFLLLSGVAGAYFTVMTNTMIITLVCSFAVSWLALPVVYLFVSRRGSRGIAEMRRPMFLGTWLAAVVRRPVWSMLFVLALGASAFVVLPFIRTGFLPDMDEGNIVLDYQSPPGTSLEQTDRMLRRVDAILATVPEVAAYSRRTGTQLGFFITEPNTGDYLITLRTDRSRSTEEVISDIRSRIERSQAALRVDFGQVIGDMLGDLMTSVQPIEVQVFGSDRERIRELSRNVASVLAKVPGTADVFDGVVIAGPSIDVRPRSDVLALYGVTPASLQFQLQTALEGNVVGSLFETEQRCNIRLVYPESEKLRVANLRAMDVLLPSGAPKPVGEFADIRLRPGEAEIEREDLQNVGIVTARLEGRDLGGTMRDIRADIARSIDLPQGYEIVYGGAYAEQQRSFAELTVILLLSSFLVFAVMLFLFRRFSIAFAILFVAVLAVAGSFLALFLTGTPLNVGSYTGAIMIVGIVGENAVFTFRQFHEYLRDHPVDDAVIFAIGTRLRPKLMTALGAIAALLPLALGLGRGAQLHQPLAIAVIGGFLTALPLLLLVLPSFIRLIYIRSPHSNVDRETRSTSV